jgi:hydroxymethylbilane synthase
MHSPVRIGTRGSQLALWQARTVATSLEALGVAAELVIIRTSGDRLQEAPLSEVGGKRLFVKEIEDALLRDEIDLAVHSAKDMPAVLPEALALGATLPREDPRDALVLRHGTTGRDAATVLAQLGDRPQIGTGSVRRIAQLSVAIPGAVFRPIRGNVDTRLRKLDAGEHDALVLASGGLRRLGLSDRISTALPTELCLPAPGQGIVAIEIRSNDDICRRTIAAVHDETAACALDAERAVVESLEGGCQLPLGALAQLRGDGLEVSAIVCSTDGARLVRAHASGRRDEAADIGRRVADRLIADGAGEILDEVRRTQGPVQGSY